MSRRAGTISFTIDGEIFDVVGSFTYNIGQPKREGLVGHDGVHGYKELPQLSFIDGEIRDRGDLSLKALLNLKDVTAVLRLANGKSVMFREGWYAGDGDVGTEEGNIQFRLEAQEAEEL